MGEGPHGQYTVTTLDDEISGGGDLATETADGNGLPLREALTGQQHSRCRHDQVRAEPCGQTLTHTQGGLAVTTSLTIDADTNGDGEADVTISGDADQSRMHNAGDSRVFSVTDATGGTITVTLNGLVIQDRYVADRGGGIYVGANDALTLTNSTVANNLAALVTVAGSSARSAARSRSRRKRRGERSRANNVMSD